MRIRGSWVWLALAAFVSVLPFVWLQAEPFFRTPRAIDVTIVDELYKPVGGAVLMFREIEEVPLAPLFPFAPHRILVKRRSCISDHQGKVRLDVQYNRTVADKITVAGKDMLVSYWETDAPRGSRPQRSRFGELPRWEFRGGPGKPYRDRTIVIELWHRDRAFLLAVPAPPLE